jgi:vacuolar-type H+-ATPase subunit H
MQMHRIAKAVKKAEQDFEELKTTLEEERDASLKKAETQVAKETKTDC